MKKVRLVLIAIALTASIGGAFATKGNVKSGSTTYGVVSDDGTNYTVNSNITGSSCNRSANACLISSNTAPVDGKIPVGDATVTQSGTFVPGN